MIRLILRLAALPLHSQMDRLREIAAQRGPEVARYMRNRICAHIWGDSPELRRHRLEHRRKARIRRETRARTQVTRSLFGEVGAGFSLGELAVGAGMVFGLPALPQAFTILAHLI